MNWIINWMNFDRVKVIKQKRERTERRVKDLLNLFAKWNNKARAWARKRAEEKRQKISENRATRLFILYFSFLCTYEFTEHIFSRASIQNIVFWIWCTFRIAMVQCTWYLASMFICICFSFKIIALNAWNYKQIASKESADWDLRRRRRRHCCCIFEYGENSFHSLTK